MRRTHWANAATGVAGVWGTGRWDRRIRAVRLALAALICLALVPTLPGTAVSAAATYYVGTTTNTAQVTTGCTSATNTTCTLRGALSLATSGGDTVTFGSAFPQGGDIDIRPGASGNYGLNLTHSVTLNGGGKGPSLDGKPSGITGVGVLLVNTGITVSLVGLRIRNGTPPAGNNGGGIFTYGTLNVTNSTLDFNTVSGGGGGGGIYINGGAVTVANSTFFGNSANFGGAVFLAMGALTVTNSTLASNTATVSGASGGGIYDDAGTSIMLKNSLVVNNNNGNVASASLSTSSINNDTSDATGVSTSLAYNGGPTPTVSVATSGPAYQNGDLATCQSLSSRGINAIIYTGSTAVDGRGAPRIVNGKCSIGAYEPGQVQTFTALTTSATSANYGQAVTLTATVLGVLGDNPGSTGTVAFTNGASAIAGCMAQPVSGGVATCTTSALPPGSDGITATYTAGSATAIYATSPASNTVTVMVAAISCTVTSTLDPSESGKLTLRDAVNVVNGGGCTGDAITFDTTVFASAQTITLASANGTLTLTHNATIIGPGAGSLTVARSTAMGTPLFRILAVNSGVTANISGLTITGGSVAGSTIGGKPYVGGNGILNQGTLTLTGVIVNGNMAINGNFADGGGVYNLSGTLTLTNSTVSGNAANNDSGGGGIFAYNGTTTITNSTLSGNTGNGAFGYGGGMVVCGGTATITNSTFSSNTASGTSGSGGGLYTCDASTTATVTITASTFSGNTTAGDGGGIRSSAGGTLNLRGSIVAGNTANTNPNIAGTVTVNTNNLTSGDPLVTPLGSYGGPTQTVALLPGSPAIDTGACPTDPTTSATLATDGRGIGRPQVASCDSGAFESQGFAFTGLVGNGGSATVTTDFTTPLALTVTSSHNEPVRGGIVTFTITPNGTASGGFEAPGSTGCTVRMNRLTAVCPVGSTGLSTAPAIKAGLNTGSFTVVASTAGVPTSGNVTYTLTNTSSAGLIAPQPTRAANGAASTPVTGTPLAQPTAKTTPPATVTTAPNAQPVRH